MKNDRNDKVAFILAALLVVVVLVVGCFFVWRFNQMWTY